VNDRPDNLFVESTRFCDRCREQRPHAGGDWKPYSHGLRRRWICGRCVERRKENDAAND